MGYIEHLRSRVAKVTDHLFGGPAADCRGQLIASSSAVFDADITPADAEIDNAPCDGIYLSDDCATLTVRLKEREENTTFTNAKAGYHPLACSRVVTVSSGSCKALWFSKPE